MLLVTDIVLYPNQTYKMKSGIYRYPTWANAVGWGLVSCSVLWVPAIAVWRLSSTKGTIMQVIYNMSYLLKPRAYSFDTGFIGHNEICLFYGCSIKVTSKTSFLWDKGLMQWQRSTCTPRFAVMSTIWIQCSSSFVAQNPKYVFVYQTKRLNIHRRKMWKQFTPCVGLSR